MSSSFLFAAHSLVLDLDGLSIDKNTLALVWFRFPPGPYLGRELHDYLLLRPL